MEPWQPITSVVAGSLDAVVVFADDGTVVDWNAAAESMFGITRASALGQSLAELIVPADDHEEHEKRLRGLRKQGWPDVSGLRQNARARRSSGETFPIELLITRVEARDRHVFRASLHDLSEAQEASTRDQQLEAVLAEADVVLFATDRVGVVTLLEGDQRALSRLEDSDILGARVHDLLADQPRALNAFAHAMDGGTVVVDVDFCGVLWQTRYSPLTDASGEAVGVVGVATDVTEERRAQHSAAQQADVEPLTGALTREGLEREMERAGFPFRCAMLHIGLDNLDLINASLGRVAGDELLRATYARLREALGETTIIARPGASHFTVVLPGARDADAIPVAERALGRLRERYCLAGAEFYAEASAGIADDRGELLDAEELVQASERAFARAQAERPGSWVVYEPLDVDPHEQLRMTARLREAIDLDRLRLVYQPIFQLQTNKPVAVEALVRWDDPDDGVISPASFIPLAEVTGMIDSVGEWVFGDLCRQASAWAQIGVTPQLHFNASPRELRSPDYAENLLRRIQAHRLPTAQFTIEVTESAAVERPEHVWPALDRLRQAGMQIALDDFGAGHSSLSRLRDLPVDTLKIDLQFLRSVPSDRGATALMRSILGVAAALRLPAVAEGIETPEQLQFLTQEGCSYGQGYLLTRPLDPAGLGILSDVRRVPAGGRLAVSSAQIIKKR